MKCSKLLFIVVLFNLLHHFSLAQTVDLSKATWQFKKAGDTQWLPAIIPGTVHTDLLNNKKITEPYFRMNEKDLQWIDQKDWDYQATFDIQRNLLTNESVDLIFEGLDTYATVFINDTKVLYADNMFLKWKAEIKKYLHLGQNKLAIHFYSPIKKVKSAYDNLGYTVPVSNNDQAYERVSAFTRKAGYHYGWDWGPRFVTSGVWRPAYIKAWSGVDLTDLFIKQDYLSEEKALLQAQLSVTSTTKCVKTLSLYVDDNSNPVFKTKVLLLPGTNQINTAFELKNIELWWPNGLGNHKLYTFKAVITDKDKIIATTQVRRGLRNLEIVQESGENGQSFYVKVNGRPVFMKGANYIPQDSFLPSVTKERYAHVINTAAESNMNILRVWGGGIYENDLFYDLCDEKGILVWQDFMFACSLYPPIDSLKQNIYQEAVYNVKRLRNHASIALWCGNNEIVQFMNENYWGQTKANWRTKADSVAVIQTYESIFHQILPAVIKTYDSDKFYWSSSPNGNNFSTKFINDKTRGDSHFWGVWHGKKPFESFKDNVSPYMSEYGFQSFPELETVKTYALPQDYNIESDVLKAHQRSAIGNTAISYYMNLYYKMPKKFTDFLYVGQLLQAEGIKGAVEAHRRAMPFCMGTMYWQIDDCWPVASWSSMDYAGRYKALQYMIKNAYKPFLVSAIRERDSVKVYVVSDNNIETACKLKTSLVDFSGNVIKSIDTVISAPANTSTLVLGLNEKQWLTDVDTTQVTLHIQILQGSKELAENLIYFAKQKNLKLIKPKIHIKKINDNHIELTTNTLAKNVWLQLPGVINPFKENYFDLIPGLKKVVEIKSDAAPIAAKVPIKITSLVDTYSN